MNIEAYDIDSLRKLVRSLQNENTVLKAQLQKANIPYEDYSHFEEKIENLENYDPVSYTHLDVYKRQVIALLKEASKKYEQTIIMITHNRSIAQTADRVLQVSDGVLTDFGRCRE